MVVMVELETKTLRDWRLVRDMTVDELAAAAGVAASTIWYAEAGIMRSRISTLLALTRALGITMDQVLWPESAAQPPANKGRRRGPKRPKEEE